MTAEQSRLEIGVYALIAIVAGVLAGLSIHSGDANGAAAWSALLMASHFHLSGRTTLIFNLKFF